jgi:hypothetical protein
MPAYSDTKPDQIILRQSYGMYRSDVHSFTLYDTFDTCRVLACQFGYAIVRLHTKVGWVCSLVYYGQNLWTNPFPVNVDERHPGESRQLN